MLEVVYTRQGLVQKTVSKRDAHVTVTSTFHLPLHLSLETWRTFGYTTQDVQDTLRAFGTNILWVLYSLVCVNTHIGTHVCEPLTHGGKGALVRRIADLVNPYLLPKETSVLCQDSPLIPFLRLPVVVVEPEEFEHAKLQIPLETGLNSDNVWVVDRFVRILNMNFVPRRWDAERQTICLMRVVDSPTVMTTFSAGDVLRGPTVVCDGLQYRFVSLAIVIRTDCARY